MRRGLLAVSVLGVLLVGVLALTGCGGGEEQAGSGATEGAGVSGTLDVSGSDTMVNLATAWSEAFMTENEEADITVKGGGSGTGIKALIDGTADFANSSREMKDEEIELAKGKGVTPVATQVARDGISVIVHPSNGVKGLTADQLGKIYRGEIKNWKDVGGADLPIALLSRDNSSGTYELFKEKIVGKDMNFAKEAKLLASNQAIVDEVKAGEGAIGYVGVGYADKATGIKILELDGVAASVASVKDGSYELSRYLYMYSNGEPTGLGKAYLDWILSAEGQKFVEDQGFVTVQ